MGATEEDRLARAALSRYGEPGDPILATEIAASGAVAAYRDRLERRDDLFGSVDERARRLAEVDPAEDLERAQAQGIRFVIPDDDEWPAPVDDLAQCPPRNDRGGPPIGLWVKGPLRLDEVAERAVAVVGSRSSTSYGELVAAEIGSTLTAHEWVTVSGGAFGIDQAAHRGAIALRGPTVAVLACGVDRVYPKAHEQLLSYIGETGLLVAETPLGGAPLKQRFLSRNRIIAALCVGSVVVEAAIRSGALSTRGWAESLGRQVMGVPGPVTSETSAGVHQLLRDGGAMLVTSGMEVLESVAPMGEFLLTRERAPEQPADRLSRLDQQVLDAVPAVKGVPEGSIARTAGLATPDTREALGRLRDHGLVEFARIDEGPGLWRVARRDEW